MSTMDLSADDLQRRFPDLAASPAKKLAAAFETTRDVEAATDDELAAVDGVGPASIEALGAVANDDEAAGDDVDDAGDASEDLEDEAWVTRYALNGALREHGHHHPTREAFYSWVGSNKENLGDDLVRAAYDMGPKNFNFASWATEDPEAYADRFRVVQAWLSDEHPEILVDAEERRAEDVEEQTEKDRAAAEERERAEQLLADPNALGDETLNGWRPIRADYWEGATIQGPVRLMGWPVGTTYPSIAAIYQDESGVWRGGEFLIADVLKSDGTLSATPTNRHLGAHPDTEEEAAEALLSMLTMGDGADEASADYPLDDLEFTINGWVTRKFNSGESYTGGEWVLIDPNQGEAAITANESGIVVVDEANETVYESAADGFDDAIEQAVAVAREHMAVLGGGTPLTEAFDGDADPAAAAFETDKQGTLEVGVASETPAEDRQVTLGGGKVGEDVRLPTGWTDSGSLDAPAEQTYTAGPLSVSLVAEDDGYDVVLDDERDTDRVHTVASAVSDPAVAAEVAERFTGMVSPQDVTFHAGDSEVMDAAAKAKEAIREANAGKGLDAFTSDDEGDEDYHFTKDEANRSENVEGADHTAADDRAMWETLLDADQGDEVRWNDRKQFATITGSRRDGLDNTIFEVEGPRGGTYELTADATNASFPYAYVAGESSGYDRITSLDVREGDRPDESADADHGEAFEKENDLRGTEGDVEETPDTESDDDAGDVDVPESVAGFTLDEHGDDKTVWSGTGARPPAMFERDAPVKVTVLNHKGRYDYAWTARARWSEGDDNHTDTITTEKFSNNSSAKNRRRATEKALAWMDEHPADGADESSDDGDDVDDQRAAIEALADGEWTAEVIGEAFGVGASVANMIEDEADHPGDVLRWNENLDDLSEAPGIGEASAKAIRQAIPLVESAGITADQAMIERWDEQDADESTPVYRNDDGSFSDDRMRDANYWAAELLGWMKNGPNAGLRGTYYVDVVAGSPVLVMDGDEHNESHAQALKDGLRDVGFPEPLRVTETDDEWRLFVSEPTSDRLVSSYYPGDWREFEATGGDGGDPAAMFQADQLDTWETPNPHADDGDADDEVTVDLEAWDNSTTRTALNAKDHPARKQFGGGEDEITLPRSDAQDAIDALVEYGKPLEPGFNSIMGQNDDSIVKAENAVRAWEAAGVEATDETGREALAAKYRAAREDAKQDALHEVPEESVGDALERTLYGESATGLRADDDAVYVGGEHRTTDHDRPERREEEEATPGFVEAMLNQPDTDAGLGDATDDQPYRIEMRTETLRKGTEFLGVLRRDYSSEGLRESLRDDGIYREDVSTAIRAVNHAVDDANGASWAVLVADEDLMSILWAATAHYATEKGNTSKLSQFENALTTAELEAEGESPAAPVNGTGSGSSADAGDDDRSRDVDPNKVYDGLERGRIKHHAGHGRFETMLSSGHFGRQQQASLIDHFVPDAGDENDSLAAVRAFADYFGDWTDFDQVGPSTAGALDAAAQLAADGLTEHADDGDDQEDDQEDDADAGDVEDEPARGEKVEFGQLTAANEWRDELGADALHESDTRRTKTITLAPDVDESIVEDTEDAALVTFADEKESYGQADLTDDERATLDARDGWTWHNNGFEARAAKAALTAEGASDWLNYYETGEGASGSLKNMEAGKERTAERGSPNAIAKDRDESETTRGDAARKAESFDAEVERAARNACEGGAEGACETLREEFGWTTDEIDALSDAVDEADEFQVLGTIYDPTREGGPAADDADDDPETSLLDAAADEIGDVAESFEDWATRAEPDADRPDDGEVAALAPTESDDPVKVEDEMTGQAYQTLRKAWGGYKTARTDLRENRQSATHYARIINGVRMTYGQDPLDFQHLDGFDGGELIPTSRNETFPGPHGQERIGNALRRLSVGIGDTYDPLAEFGDAEGDD